MSTWINGRVMMGQDEPGVTQPAIPIDHVLDEFRQAGPEITEHVLPIDYVLDEFRQAGYVPADSFGLSSFPGITNLGQGQIQRLLAHLAAVAVAHEALTAAISDYEAALSLVNQSDYDVENWKNHRDLMWSTYSPMARKIMSFGLSPSMIQQYDPQAAADLNTFLSYFGEWSARMGGSARMGDAFSLTVGGLSVAASSWWVVAGLVILAAAVLVGVVVGGTYAIQWVAGLLSKTKSDVEIAENAIREAIARKNQLHNRVLADASIPESSKSQILADLDQINASLKLALDALASAKSRLSWLNRILSVGLGGVAIVGVSGLGLYVLYRVYRSRHE